MNANTGSRPAQVWDALCGANSQLVPNQQVSRPARVQPEFGARPLTLQAPSRIVCAMFERSRAPMNLIGKESVESTEMELEELLSAA